MKIVLLGTGATIGTLGKSGGVEHFVKRLNEASKTWRRDYPDLNQLIKDCDVDEGKIRLDQIWTRIDYYSKFKRILVSDYGANASIQLHKAVLEAYSFTKEIDCLLKDNKKEFTLKNILSKLETGDTLISFNWVRIPV
jgi:hypothetical protein